MKYYKKTVTMEQIERIIALIERWEREEQIKKEASKPMPRRTHVKR